jgi:protein-tyrosine-phosphatase
MTLRVLVVCTANVCRSPMAEAMLRHHLHKRGVDAAVASAGTQAHRHQLGVDPLSVATMQAWDIDISGHQPQPVTDALLDQHHLVVTMTREQLRELAVIDDGALQRSFTLVEAVRLLPPRPLAAPAFDAWLAHLRSGRTIGSVGLDDDGARDDIGDPYRLPLAAHQACGDDLYQLTGRLAQSLAGAITAPRP